MKKPKHFNVNVGGKSVQRRIAVRSSDGGGKSAVSTEISPTLDALRLKQAYTFEYRQAQGRRFNTVTEEYSPSRSYDAQGIWRDAAQLLRSKEIDPLRYIRVVFTELRSRYFFNNKYDTKDCRPCTPAELVSNEIFELYGEVLKRQHYQAKVEFDMERARFFSNFNSLTRHMSRSKALCLAFVDTIYNTQALAPLARFGMATFLIQTDTQESDVKKINDVLYEIADDCYMAACRQYGMNEAGYSAAWPEEYLSPTIVRDSPKIYEKWISEVRF